MSDTDFGALIEPVARHFWGDPTKGMITKLSMRFGGQGSKSIDLQKGAWFDHEAGEGGNVIELVMREVSVDKAGAIEWMATEGFIPPMDSAAASQPRQEPRNAAPAPEHPAEPHDLPVDTPQGKKVDVDGYTYTDGDGNKLYQVLRQQWLMPDGSWQIDPKTGNPKKTFVQRRPDGAGGWIYNLDGIGHTIFRHQQVEIAIAEGKTIYLVEGEKDVHTIEGFGLVGSTNSGGANHWNETHAARFRDADVVIIPDNDDAGRSGALKRAMTLRRVARRVRMLDFAEHVPNFVAKGDVTDWRDKLGGDAAKLGEIVNTLVDWRPPPPVSGMGAVGVHELHHPSLKHDFLIADFLDRQGVAMMPGASGSGKTFVILEVCMCVATAQPFWGMAVKPGLVLYQAGEGKQGVTKRLDAWLQDRRIEADPSIPFKMLTRRINLFVDDKDTDLFIDEGKKWSDYYGVPMRLAVVDTFNKAITGANEISGQDMSKVLSRLERISVELDCAVLSPIHKSKEGGMRGHTSLKGDVSNVIEVNELAIRDHNGRIVRTVTLDKNKDGEKGKPFRFVLRQVVLEMNDETGKAVTTCVIDKPDGDEEEAAKQGRLTLPAFLALKALREAQEDHAEPIPNGVRAGSSVRSAVKYSAWQDRVAKTWVFTAPEEEVEKRKTELLRVMTYYGKVLLAGDYIGRDNALGIVWLTGKDDRPKRESKPVEKAKPSPLMSPEDQEVPF